MELNNIWKVKVTQSSTTLCNPMDYTVHGILQARILQKIDVPFSRRSSQPRDRIQVSHIAGGFESRSPTLQVDCLPAEPSGKPTFGYFYFHAFIFMFISSNFRDHSSLVHLNLRQAGTWDPLLQCLLLDKLFSPATKYKETIGD